MLDYQIQPLAHKCCVTGRELKPGDKHFTVLLEENGVLVRREHGAESWQGPPENAFAFWSGVVPTGDKEKRPPIDDDLLMECFTRLEDEQDAGKQNFRYVLGLLLMRRKRLKFEEVTGGQGRRTMVLRCPQTRAAHQVVQPQLSDEQMAAVQDEVLRVLGW